MSLHFYRDLPVRTRFGDVARPEAYTDAPPDWHVVVADVRGSTQAVEAGQYKAVNMVGASVITAVLNATTGHDVPFVFGGDGASLLVPDALMAPVRAALLGTRAMAAAAFGLDLRVGAVPVAAIHAAGPRVRVGRFRMAAHYEQAMFSGGGLSWAEDQIKAPGSPFLLDGDATADAADFSGLECRWQDLPSPHGETVALLVRATDPGDAAVYREALGQIEAAFGGAPEPRPVRLDVLRASFSFRRLWDEARVRTPAGLLRRAAYTGKIWAQQGLLALFVRFGLTTGDTHWPSYLRLLVETSDYRKYDDMLRLVLSGTTSQREALTAYLESAYARGRLVYGLHVSDRAHMTCLVFDRMGRQVHFLDAADGGYALAARDLKHRLRA
jgi:hypothetical protein